MSELMILSQRRAELQDDLEYWREEAKTLLREDPDRMDTLVLIVQVKIKSLTEVIARFSRQISFVAEEAEMQKAVA